MEDKLVAVAGRHRTEDGDEIHVAGAAVQQSMIAAAQQSMIAVSQLSPVLVRVAGLVNEVLDAGVSVVAAAPKADGEEG